MARERQQILFRFPQKGVVLTHPKNEQPENTCHDAQNVRPFDQIESRSRGGSRPGLVKYSTARGSTNRIQDLNYVTIISNSLSVTSLSRRTIIPVQVCNGVIAMFNTTAVTNASVAGTQALGNATQSPFAFSAEMFQRLYYADGFGYKTYVGANNAAIDWSPTAGSLPGDQTNTIVCRLVEQWRGRIVLSGLATDPHNWFMSKLGDPLNWDYNPATETELDAVQGGAGFVGKVPDIINAIIPYNDDVLLFGCDHSIWMMSGDPQAGGRLDLVTNTVGMAFGRPYTQLPDGTLIFMSNRGSVYRMAPGAGKPMGITADSIDPLITNTNLNTNIIRMVYDEGEDGVHLFISPLAGSTNTTHWYFDVRNEGWFKVVYADNLFNPISLVAFDGDAFADRVIMLGGDDGYVRTYSSSAFRDDGQNFTSYVTMGPIVADKGRYPTVLTDVQFIMDNTAGNTVYELGVGDTAELALGDFAATLTGEKDLSNTTINISAGKSVNHNPRTRGYFQYFKIGTTSPTANWAIEYIQASYNVIKSSKGRVIASEDISYLNPDDGPLMSDAGLYALYRPITRAVSVSDSPHTNAIASWTPIQGPGTQALANGNASNHPVWNGSDAILNSKPSISFGAVGNATARVLTGAFTAGASHLDVGNGFVTFVAYSNSASDDGNFFDFCRTGSLSVRSEMEVLANGRATVERFDGSSFDNTPIANSSLVANTAYVWTMGYTGSNYVIRRNGVEIGNAANTFFWDDIDTGAGITLFLAAQNANGGEWHYMTMGDFAIYNIYSLSVIQNVENAMASHYGITL